MEPMETAWTVADALQSVAENGLNLERIPLEKRTKQVCALAVQKNAAALRFVPDALKTQDMCIDAAASSSCPKYILPLVPEAARTPYFWYSCIRLAGERLEPFMDELPEDMKTKEIFSDLLSANGLVLHWMPASMIDAGDCMLACMQNPKAAKSIPAGLLDETTFIALLNFVPEAARNIREKAVPERFRQLNVTTLRRFSKRAATVIAEVGVTAPRVR